MSADLIFFTLIMGLIFFRVIVALIQSICIVPAQTEFVIERLGKYYGTLKAGFHLLIPFLDIVSFKLNSHNSSQTHSPLYLWVSKSIGDGPKNSKL